MYSRDISGQQRDQFTAEILVELRALPAFLYGIIFHVDKLQFIALNAGIHGNAGIETSGSAFNPKVDSIYKVKLC